MLITPQHQELQNKYEQLLLKSMQFDATLKQKDEIIQQLQSQINSLKNLVEQLLAEVKLLREQNAALLDIIKEKDRRIQKLELVEHQYNQLTKLVYGRNSEKTSTTLSGQLSLRIDAELIEACKINDGQKTESYTKIKSEKETSWQKRASCSS